MAASGNERMNELTGLAIEREQGPSWARPNWPVAELDPVNLGLDPTEATIEKVAEKAKAAAVATGVTDEAAIRRAADDSIRAMMLIRTYRVRGHLAAKLDPLGLYHSELPADLTPAYHGFSDADLDRKIWLGGDARLRAGLDPPDPAGAAGDLLRHGRLRIYAHQRPGGAALHPGPDRKRRTRPSSSRPRASARSWRR